TNSPSQSSLMLLVRAIARWSFPTRRSSDLLAARIAGGGPTDSGGAAAGGERARPPSPLQSAQPPEPRHRPGVLPAGLVHDEIQPKSQRVGGPPARTERVPSPGSARAEPGRASCRERV